jgi:hypothetical protein
MHLPRGSRGYKSEKRKKEVLRQKKQEEKRKRRQGKYPEPKPPDEMNDSGDRPVDEQPQPAETG